MALAFVVVNAVDVARPYADADDDRLAVAAHWALAFSLLIALLIEVGVVRGDHGGELNYSVWYLDAAMCALPLCVLLLAVVGPWWAMIREHARRAHALAKAAKVPPGAWARFGQLELAPPGLHLAGASAPVAPLEYAPSPTAASRAAAERGEAPVAFGTPGKGAPARVAWGGDEAPAGGAGLPESEAQSLALDDPAATPSVRDAGAGGPANASAADETTRVDSLEMVREVALPPGALGLVFEPGTTVIAQVRASSAIVGRVCAREKIVAFAKPGEELREDCARMSDTELVELLNQHRDEQGRRIYVESTTAAEQAKEGP